jgi:hypothetical protein
MTTIKTILRLVALVLRSIDWVAVGRVCWLTIQLIAFVLVLLSEIAWEHRQQIRQAVVVAIAAVIFAAQLSYEAGCWTHQAIDGLSRRSAALLPQQPVPAIAPITATLAAAREALERLVSRLYPNPVTA